MTQRSASRNCANCSPPRLPSARIDAQASWLAPVFHAIASLQWLALGLVVLLAATSAAAVWLAARSALGSNRDTIEIVHLLGGTDGQIARIFQRSIAIDALAGRNCRPGAGPDRGVRARPAVRRARFGHGRGRRPGLARLAADRGHSRGRRADRHADRAAYRAGGAEEDAVIRAHRRRTLRRLGARLRLVRRVPAAAAAGEEQTDAIVVPTGGRAGSIAGSSCCARGRRRQLLVTGVDREVKPQRIRRRIQGKPAADGLLRHARFRGARHPGQCARNRQMDGQAQDYRSLRLVTTDWHMRRGRARAGCGHSAGGPVVKDAVHSDAFAAASCSSNITSCSPLAARAWRAERMGSVLRSLASMPRFTGFPCRG